MMVFSSKWLQQYAAYSGSIAESVDEQRAYTYYSLWASSLPKREAKRDGDR